MLDMPYPNRSLLALQPHKDAFIVLGQIGLVLLVLEGGMHIELKTLQLVGLKATAIALSGTIIPILLSVAVLYPIEKFSFKESVVAGTSLSSTAIGMAAKLMQSFEMMDCYAGQLICCAAMIDGVWP